MSAENNQRPKVDMLVGPDGEVQLSLSPELREYLVTVVRQIQSGEAETISFDDFVTQQYKEWLALFKRKLAEGLKPTTTTKYSKVYLLEFDADEGQLPGTLDVEMFSSEVVESNPALKQFLVDNKAHRSDEGDFFFFLEKKTPWVYKYEVGRLVTQEEIEPVAETPFSKIYLYSDGKQSFRVEFLDRKQNTKVLPGYLTMIYELGPNRGLGQLATFGAFDILFLEENTIPAGLVLYVKQYIDSHRDNPDETTSVSQIFIVHIAENDYRIEFIRGNFVQILKAQGLQRQIYERHPVKWPIPNHTHVILFLDEDQEPIGRLYEQRIAN